MKLFTLKSIILFFATIQADQIQNLIKKAHFPVEIHSTYTPDGFKLRLHRITRKNQEKSVILVHGFLESGAQWVVGQQPLAFMLADAGYDVWIFNARGTTFSGFHRKFNVFSKEYWDYSFHEIGSIDLPSAIDYIQNITGRKPIDYVGYSQGGNVPLILLSMHPEYNKKLKSLHLLAPAVFLQNSTSFAKMLYPLMEIPSSMGFYAVNPRIALMQGFIDAFCQSSTGTAEMCADFLFAAVGRDTGQANRKQMVTFFIKNVANRVSFKQIEHFGQITWSGHFSMFDYGESKNEKIYKSKTAKPYNLSAVEVPVTIYYGSKDALVPVDGIQLLKASLPNLKEAHEYDYNHFDFTFAQNVGPALHRNIIDSLDVQKN